MAEISRNPFLLMGIAFTPADNALRLSFGKRAVGSAAAVMTKNVPDYAVAVGDPAQIIRYPDTSRFADKMQKAIFKLTTSVSVHLRGGACFCIVLRARGHTVRRR